eukprot:CAMPEP_0195001752 /NCGR_PEP_ID=MMETSP0326_2-20130528/1773_1 /TAXON_ID=2866 ORGANISM="Crypthecodinium cohnii, Strain Seligo" /NCGR_SAMPLE_ID=MMETSP0326_2 /ASSEMBLY_ACC=CAM_ASM_000348 /LENGTH=71 /DNA_ID=CAMNT_0040004599 /DNA_START=1 /DNA_END=213 /DNA_ORIENTATION=-
MELADNPAMNSSASQQLELHVANLIYESYFEFVSHTSTGKVRALLKGMSELAMKLMVQQHERNSACTLEGW